MPIRKPRAYAAWMNAFYPLPETVLTPEEEAVNREIELRDTQFMLELQCHFEDLVNGGCEHIPPIVIEQKDFMRVEYWWLGALYEKARRDRDARNREICGLARHVARKQNPNFEHGLTDKNEIALFEYAKDSRETELDQ